LALENVLTVKQDVEKQLAMALEHNQQIDSAKDELNKELENASDYIVRLEDKFYEAKKTSLDLLKCVKDSEAEIDQLKDEIEMLKAYIIDLKSRIAVYIPVKGDAIDKKMAEYINNYPDRQKLKIMFMRESEGVYQFGTKRIGVKVAKDKIEIRVGGGFLSIDEFLDQYTPAELEKLERKDPIKRKSERLAVQKVLVGKEQRESSPIQSRNSPRRSPKKQAI
jgi:chromosome segregation ATPase